MIGVCPQCTDLITKAQAASSEHFRIVDRLQTARLRHDAGATPALEMELRRANAAREKAVAAYKAHTASHAERLDSAA